MRIQRCPACGHVPNFERVACPRCLHELEWVESAGSGTVETFTVIHRTHAERYEPHVPIVMAVIALDDGAQVISTIVGDDRLETEIGARVEPADGWSELQQFRLSP
jgi:uncharacterized OB-fold protein